MTASALVLLIIGLCLTFFAAEITDYLLPHSTPLLQLLIQLLGALYFAFSMLNWMTKESIIGGIYNRPIVMANLAHFCIGGLAAIKSAMNHPTLPPAIWIVAGVYAIFAVLFGVLLFRSPVSKSATTAR